MSKHLMTALNAYESCLASPELMKAALKYYITRFPQHASEAVGQEIAPLAQPPKKVIRIKRNWSGNGWTVGTEIAATLDQWKAIDFLMRQDQKVEAIKALRAASGCSLKEGKDMVEYVGTFPDEIYS